MFCPTNALKLRVWRFFLCLGTKSICWGCSFVRYKWLFMFCCFFVWCWLSFMRTCWVKNQELCHSMKFRAFVVQGFINVCFCVFSVFSWRNGALCLFYGLRNLDRRMLTLSCVFFFLPEQWYETLKRYVMCVMGCSLWYTFWVSVFLYCLLNLVSVLSIEKL